MNDKPIALDAYQILAEAYASVVDTKPHNAFYERPATLSLLPEVRGLRVLDAGCGPGVYTEWLLARGAAAVTAIDASPKMIELARGRVGERAVLRVADLGRPLDFFDSGSFDLVLSSLVVHYIEDWRPLFAEIHRVLRPGGHFVFSDSHPFFDFLYFKSENYFATERVSAVWTGFPGTSVEMPSFRRSLEETVNPLLEAGFRLEKLLEPKATEQLRQADPKHYEELSKQPCFVCFRARKDESR
jgi:SAM-dependent methyltransferase